MERRLLRLGMVVAGLSLSVAGAAAQSRVYVDPANGVRFAYPGGWLLNGDDDAATAKFRITAENQPVAVVQLEGNFAGAGPYKGTDFEAGAFAYVVVPHKTEEQCAAILQRGLDPGQQPEQTTWNGMAAKRFVGSYSIAGTKDEHEIVAVERNERCYLFETAIVSKSVGGPIKALAPARWRLIRSQFAGVLRSARIAAVGVTAAKP